MRCALLICCAALASGCETHVATPLQFVDGLTGQPLEGVKVSWSENGSHTAHFGRLFPHKQEHDLGPTGPDGRVTFWRVRTWHNVIDAKRPGYVLVTGSPDDMPYPPTDAHAWVMMYAPGETADSFRTDPATASRHYKYPAASGDALVRIPMYPPPGPRKDQ